MKIAILVNDFKEPWDEGGKNNIHHLAVALAKKHSLFFIGMSDETAVVEFPFGKSYLFRSPFYLSRWTRCFSPLGYLYLIIKARKVFTKEQPDLLFSYFETASTTWIAALIRRFYAPTIPLVSTVWSNWFQKGGAPFSIWLSEQLPHIIFNNRWLSKYALQKADILYASSQYLTKEVSRLTSKEVTFTPTGIDTHSYFPKTDQQTTHHHNSLPHVGYVGHLTYTKGVSLLAAVIRPWLEAGKITATFAVTAGEEEMALLKQLAVIPGVDILGIVNPRDVYWRADLVIIPRRFSYGSVAYPNVVLEAMASGVAVLTTTQPGIEEIIQHNKTGFLCAPNSLDALEEAFRKIIEEPLLLKKVGVQAAQFVHQELSWQGCADKIITQLESDYAKWQNKSTSV